MLGTQPAPCMRDARYRSANLDPKAFQNELSEQHLGVYAGWAQVDGGPVYKSVLSIGYNPYFKNTERTLVSQWLLSVLTWHANGEG